MQQLISSSATRQNKEENLFLQIYFLFLYKNNKKIISNIQLIAMSCYSIAVKLLHVKTNPRGNLTNIPNWNFLLATKLTTTCFSLAK